VLSRDGRLKHWGAETGPNRDNPAGFRMVRVVDLQRIRKGSRHELVVLECGHSFKIRNSSWPYDYDKRRGKWVPRPYLMQCRQCPRPHADDAGALVPVEVGRGQQ
jgi:hypothetical protein